LAQHAEAGLLLSAQLPFFWPSVKKGRAPAAERPHKQIQPIKLFSAFKFLKSSKKIAKTLVLVPKVIEILK
jgi:hypothetical protein